MIPLPVCEKLFVVKLGPQLIRVIDRLAGIPLCAFLTLFERTKAVFRPRSAEAPRRIVFIKLIEMGAGVLAYPAFAEAERMVGRKNMYILVLDENRIIFDVLDCFPPENIITIDGSTLGSFATGLWRAIRRVRREQVDTAVDLEGLTRSSAIITWLTGARNRAGYHNFTCEGPYRGRLFTRELNYTFEHHVSEMFLALVHALRSPANQTPMLKERIPRPDAALPEFTPGEGEVNRVRELLAEKAGHEVSGKIVVLNTKCTDLLPVRRWPIDRYVELGKRMLKEFSGITIVITGPEREVDLAREIAADIGPEERVFSIAGRTSMRELLTLYCISDLVVSSDSGPCHFASLTTIRSVCLFGPETPLLYGPLGGRARVITANLACSPCMSILNHRLSPCTDNRCMQEISVDEVLEAVAESLGTLP